MKFLKPSPVLRLLFLQKCSTVDVLPVSKSTSVTSYIYIQIFQVYKPGETFQCHSSLPTHHQLGGRNAAAERRTMALPSTKKRKPKYSKIKNFQILNAPKSKILKSYIKEPWKKKKVREKQKKTITGPPDPHNVLSHFIQ